MTSTDIAMGYDTATLVVGLEIHVELATKSKMFTRAPNLAHPEHYDAEPNTLTDPVVLGMPGVLPVINRQAVEMAMRVGLALNARIARFTKWDRKSYYYPDLPKNYQISQYDRPLCEEGHLDIPVDPDNPTGETKRVRIIRAHLEEDAGKLLHEAPGGIPIDHSIVDLNRAGTPLLEIVTYPDLNTPEEVVSFGQTLRDVCRHLGVSEGIMQKGHMRFEPNINVVIEKNGETYKTPIVEIKNLNSFRAVHGAVAHEYKRQIEAWLEHGEVMGKRAKTTRGWDDNRLVTTLQRHKEDADEYRYFPDPDLVPLRIDAAWIEQVRATVSEPPLSRLHRYVNEFGIGLKEAQQILDEPRNTAYFERVRELGADAKKAAAVIFNYGAKRANERGERVSDLPITPEQVKGIMDLMSEGKVGSSAADELFGHCCDQAGVDPATLAEQHDLLQVSDTSELEDFVDQVLADPKSEKAIKDIAAGKDKAVGALLGQIMKLTGGKADPKTVREMFILKIRGE